MIPRGSTIQTISLFYWNYSAKKQRAAKIPFAAVSALFFLSNPEIFLQNLSQPIFLQPFSDQNRAAVGHRFDSRNTVVVVHHIKAQPGGLLTGADREISFRPANIPKHAGHHAL